MSLIAELTEALQEAREEALRWKSECDMLIELNAVLQAKINNESTEDGTLSSDECSYQLRIEQLSQERDYWRGECERLSRQQYFDFEQFLKQLFDAA